MNTDECHQQSLEEQQMEEEFERIDECMEALEELSRPWWFTQDRDEIWIKEQENVNGT